MKKNDSRHYFFVWGRHPGLAAAEILSLLSRMNIMSELIDASVEAGIVRVRGYLPSVFISQLGGTVKFGRVIDVKPSKTRAGVIAHFLAERLISLKLEKILFGLSQYRVHNLSRTFSVGIFNTIGKLMKRLIKRHTRVRWVTSRENTLSSVVVHKNKILERGGEFVFLHGEDRLWIGTTIAVQPFEEYSMRDYGRIAVDPVSGMIPPKLAHIMLNFSCAKTNDTILDPFCGSGTILQEALTMGWSNLIGTDISPRAIDATKKNTDWILQKYGLTKCFVRLFRSDARTLSLHLKKYEVSAIVTEPYLGPALKKRITKDNAQKIIHELEEQYTEALLEFSRFLKHGSTVVIVFPVFVVSAIKDGLLYLQLIQRLKKYGYVIREPYVQVAKAYALGTTSERGTYIYGRPRQKLWREIVVFEYRGKG